jgi:hypothetical protein
MIIERKTDKKREKDWRRDADGDMDEDTKIRSAFLLPLGTSALH